MVRRMHIRDGYALQLAVKQGYRVVVISGATSDMVINRLTRLGVTDIHMGVHDKAAVMQEYLQRYALKQEETLFMGDDMPDLEVMQQCGLPCAPADACAEIQAISRYISPARGGEGCVRDVIEKVLKLNGHWQHTPAVASR
jgi:3-deoxy-D-manno-octulosonate 8-phosphate phosphatase (KDO 8-P phosphatase)